MEPNELAHDVITKAPAAQSEPVLAPAGCDSFEFLDVMTPRSVVGILGQDSSGASFGGIEITMVSVELVGQPDHSATSAGATKCEP